MKFGRRLRVPLTAAVLTSMVGLTALGGFGVFAADDGAGAELVAAAERSARCDSLAIRAGDVLQAYVGQLATPAGDRSGDVAVPRDLAAESAALRTRLEREGCDQDTFRDRLAEEIEGLSGEGPVADAVAARLRASVLGDSVPVVGPTSPVEVKAGEDVAAAVAATPAGGVLRLGPGEHRMSETLVVLADLRLIGAGRDATRVVTTAPDAGVLLVADGRTTLADLTVQHEGASPASVVVVAAGTFALDGVRIGGGVTGADGGGGHGIVTLGAAAAASPGEGSLVESSEVSDNAAGGVTVLGGPPVRLVDSVVTRNGACGICVLGAGTGRIEGGSVTQNVSGVVAGGTGSVSVERTLVQGNAEAGLVLDEQATGSVTAATVTGNGSVGVVARGASSGTLSGLTVSGHAEVGVAVAGTSTVTLSGGSIAGSRIGVQVADAAAPTVDRVGVEAREAAVLLGGSGRAVVRSLSCSGAGTVVVVLGDAAPEVADAGCRVVRQEA